MIRIIYSGEPRLTRKPRLVPVLHLRSGDEIQTYHPDERGYWFRLLSVETYGSLEAVLLKYTHRNPNKRGHRNWQVTKDASIWARRSREYQHKC